MTLFQLSNYVEAALWLLIALIFAIFAFIKRGPIRVDCTLAVIAFSFFGWSDIIEAGTGAWWRPWWLLVWKGLCLAVIAMLLWRYVRRKHLANGATRAERGNQPLTASRTSTVAASLRHRLAHLLPPLSRDVGKGEVGISKLGIDLDILELRTLR